MPRSFGQASPPTDGGGGRGFTLPEILVAMAVLVIMLGFLMAIVTQSSRIWQQASGQRANRQAARILLELMGGDLESAVFPLDSGASALRFRLNPASLAGSGALNPAAAFWQASRNGSGSANGDVQDVGWFVQWVADDSGVARGTLCRMAIPPTNSDSIFQSQTLNAALLQKYAPGLNDTALGSATAYKGLVAENVLGLWITLYDRGMVAIPSPYDSQLPGSARPAYADISVAMLDPRIAKRITMANLGTMVTSQYTASSVSNAATFVAKLPAEIQAGAQAFAARIEIHAGR